MDPSFYRSLQHRSSLIASYLHPSRALKIWESGGLWALRAQGEDFLVLGFVLFFLIKYTAWVISDLIDKLYKMLGLHMLYVCVSHSVMSSIWDPTDCSLARLFCLWNSLGKNTGVGSHSPLQRIFPTQGLNSGLTHCRQILYNVSHQRSSTIICSYRVWS